MKFVAFARRVRELTIGCCLLAAPACNVADPPSSTGGAIGRRCERFAVVRSDYASTQISLVDADGKTTSANVISSGTSAPGTTAALSGDIALPHDPPASGRLVVIDRYPNGILTWVDPDSGDVLGQLNVVPGFPSNPHDYVDLAPDKAYVTRFQTNRDGGKVQFDEGGDVLVIDPSRRTLTKRIDLAPYGGSVDPRPDRMTRAGALVYVALARLDASFRTGADGLVAVIDVENDRVIDTIHVSGFRNCGALALSPDAQSLAISCSGVFAAASEEQLAGSGIVVIDLKSKQERLRVGASALGGTVSQSIGFSRADTLAAVVFADHVVSIDVPSGRVSTLHTSRASFVLGELTCGCGGGCLLADGEAASLLSVDPAKVTLLGELSGSSLPPRSVGAVGPQP